MQDQDGAAAEAEAGKHLGHHIHMAGVDLVRIRRVVAEADWRHILQDIVR